MNIKITATDISKNPALKKPVKPRKPTKTKISKTLDIGYGSKDVTSFIKQFSDMTGYRVRIKRDGGYRNDNGVKITVSCSVTKEEYAAKLKSYEKKLEKYQQDMINYENAVAEFKKQAAIKKLKKLQKEAEDQLAELNKKMKDAGLVVEPERRIEIP